ncbi:MAG: hypothetical protein AB2693_11500, partial [Candidatus Thiodiazotropha sp.]
TGILTLNCQNVYIDFVKVCYNVLFSLNVEGLVLCGLEETFILLLLQFLTILFSQPTVWPCCILI